MEQVDRIPEQDLYNLSLFLEEDADSHGLALHRYVAANPELKSQSRQRQIFHYMYDRLYGLLGGEDINLAYPRYDNDKGLD